MYTFEYIDLIENFLFILTVRPEKLLLFVLQILLLRCSCHRHPLYQQICTILLILLSFFCLAMKVYDLIDSPSNYSRVFGWGLLIKIPYLDLFLLMFLWLSRKAIFFWTEMMIIMLDMLPIPSSRRNMPCVDSVRNIKL